MIYIVVGSRVSMINQKAPSFIEAIYLTESVDELCSYLTMLYKLDDKWYIPDKKDLTQAIYEGTSRAEFNLYSLQILTPESVAKNIKGWKPDA